MRGGDSKRLGALTEQIAVFPNAAVNYVLRGELYAKHGEYALAAADFGKGLALASAQLLRANWGFVEQAVQDRAELGLRRVQRYLVTLPADMGAVSIVPAETNVEAVLDVSESNDVSDNERHSDDEDGVRGGGYGENRQSDD
ncbi:MAG: hypothetical protein SGI73_08365 [Chloroflexota bacterium]|nr:hypothetical protein [Chloroflexota bacterium]